jgi:CBS domain-containing protein
MQAADVMTPHVITVGPDSEVREIATLLLEHGISAVPVVDDAGKVLGIVSEGDLMRRVETQGDEHKSWWLKLFTGHDAGEYVRSHGRRASEIMTRDPVTVTEDEPLYRVAKLLEKRRIKRVPVVREGRLVGIVSRANLLRGFSTEAPASAGGQDDRQIRRAILDEVEANTRVLVDRLNVIVADGQVQLWGLVESQEEKQAVEVAAENTAGVKEIENHLGFVPRGVSSY